jgi:hypothetical protein
MLTIRLMTRRLVTGLGLLSSLLAVTVSAQDLELLRLPKNSAITIPAGQGLDLIGSAEPLGKGRFRMRSLNRSHSVVLPELGGGSAYTGYYSIAYGMTPSLDVSLVVPFLNDAAGGFNKYGSGDPVLGFKWSRPGTIPSNHYTALELLIGLPFGYKGEHALDQVGGIRQFSSSAMDFGFQGLMDVHFHKMSIYVNGGLFRPGNPDVVTQLVYGFGLESGRASRWVSFNGEYEARVAFGTQSRAANIFKFGVRLHVFRGVEIELARELGFLDHPSPALTTIGVRTHGFLSGQRRFEPRFTIYKPVPPPKRIYEPDQVLRIAVADFDGFEEYDAGRRLINKFRNRLAPHDSIEVVDLNRYTGIRKKGALTPAESIELARRIGVDVVVSGTVSQYKIDRFAGLRVPYVFELPETEVEVGLRYRVMWFSSAARTDMEALTDQIKGQGRVRKRLRLLPADQHDITVSRSAAELARVHDEALDDVVSNLLDSMARTFSWIPPDFAHASF